jgi:porphobilinogen synthase
MAEVNTNAMSLRRLRGSPILRDLVREVRLDHRQFMQPYFVAPVTDTHRDAMSIPGLTGTYRETPDTLLKRIESDLEQGVRSGLLFGMPATKSAAAPFNVDETAATIARVKKAFGDAFFLSVDVCFCSFSSHGHCGVLSHEGDHLQNDATVAELARAAGIYAQAGADCVAPSDMMDGRVQAIRSELTRLDLERTILMSYSAKFHSKFYGPFRVAADSAPKAGAAALKLTDRATYQIDPGRFDDALASSLRDDDEGADILMVKPGMPYLDVLWRLSQSIAKPWAVYEVSGEYAAIELMAAQNLMNGPAAHVEAWTSLTRAGARIIISYGARHARQWINEFA